MENERPEFRNGLPMRLFGWLQIRVGKLYKKKVSRFVKLNGEVLSIHTNEHSLPTDQFDVYGAVVEYSRSNSTKKDFRIVIGKKVLYVTCGSYEEMKTWATSMEFASARNFYDCYNIGAKIGSGNNTKIYLCYDAVHPNLEYVVKIISRKYTNTDFEALKWLERERHINTVISHRCIVQAKDMFASTDHVHIVFEYMKGGTIRSLLNSHKKLGESYAKVILRELLVSLYYLHGKNIVHRDVRPDNLFCSHKKFPMAIALGDFGYANFFSDKVVNQDVLTTIIGTPPYTAAEICRREKYGPAVDLWSAGITLYEILCGRTPFQGRNDRETNELIIRGRLTFAEPEWKNISSNAKKLIRQLLQPDPHKRISALAALQHAWFGANGARLQTTPSAQRLITPSESQKQLLNQRFDDDQSEYRKDRSDELKVTSISSSEGSSDREEMERPPQRAFTRNALSQGPRRMQRVESAASNVSMDRLSKRSSAPLRKVGSQSSLPYNMSMSSLSSGFAQQSKMAMTPSMQRIQEVGLERAAKENPARMKAFLKSPVVKSQLSSMFVMRRKLIVTSRALIAVFRMRALIRGQSLTRNLSRVGSVKKVDVKIADQRKELAERDRSPVVEDRARYYDDNKSDVTGVFERNTSSQRGGVLERNTSSQRGEFVRNSSSQRGGVLERNTSSQRGELVRNTSSHRGELVRNSSSQRGSQRGGLERNTSSTTQRRHRSDRSAAPPSSVKSRERRSSRGVTGRLPRTNSKGNGNSGNLARNTSASNMQRSNSSSRNSYNSHNVYRSSAH